MTRKLFITLFIINSIISNMLFPHILCTTTRTEYRLDLLQGAVDVLWEKAGTPIIGVEMLTKDTRGIDLISKFLLAFTTNAFATDNGIIFTAPMLLSSNLTDEELVAILCHEVAHIKLFHSIKVAEKANKMVMERLVKLDRVPSVFEGIKIGLEVRNSQELLDLKRIHEGQADWMGAQLMMTLGLNPLALKSALEKTTPKILEWLPESKLDHPHLKTRFLAIDGGIKGGPIIKLQQR